MNRASPLCRRRRSVSRTVHAASILAAFSILAMPRPGQAQSGTVTGRVLERESGEPLPSVTVELVTGGGRTVASTATGEEGRFRFDGVAAGRYSLLVSSLGYETGRVDGVVVGAETVSVGDVELVSIAFRLNPIVVSVSREQEKVLESPAAVHIVDSGEIEERPSTTAVDHVLDLPGADVFTTGLSQHNVAARGFNNVFSAGLRLGPVRAQRR